MQGGALGAEQTVCSGCDLCDERRGLSEGKKKRPSDWQMAYNIIRKARNYYSEEEIESELFERMNSCTRSLLGLNVWTHKDTVEIVKQLKASGRVETDNFLWKNRLRVRKEGRIK